MELQALKGAFVEAIRATMGEYSRFQVMRIIEWGQKSKPKKIPRLKLTPKNTLPNF